MHDVLEVGPGARSVPPRADPKNAHLQELYMIPPKDPPTHGNLTPEYQALEQAAADCSQTVHGVLRALAAVASPYLVNKEQHGW